MANYVARFDSFFAITDHHLAAAIWPFIENVSIPKLGFASQNGCVVAPSAFGVKLGRCALPGVDLATEALYSRCPTGIARSEYGGTWNWIAISVRR